MKKSLASLSLSALVLGNTGVALASHEVDSVTITPVSVPGCGTQSLTFSGTATFSAAVQHLVVTLDGVALFDDHSEPAAWASAPVSVSEGSHTLIATIYDHASGDGHTGIEAAASATFSVSGCAAAGGEDRDTDCCPGPDVVVAKKLAGKVKGAVARPSLVPKNAKPINELFRKVYGRTPTEKEWAYWARRLNDKPRYDALYGAMQWQQLHGWTIGK